MTVGPGGVERARVSLRVVPDVSAVYEAVNAAVQYIEKLTPHLKVDADTKKARGPTWTGSAMRAAASPSSSDSTSRTP